MTKSVFAYRNGVLCAEALPLSEMAEEIDTPFFCTSLKQIRRNVHALIAPFEALGITVDYVSSMNGTLAVMRALAQEGAHMDVSCAGEMTRALEACGNPSTLVLSGIMKTVDDIAAALLASVGRIKAESLADLRRIGQKARELSRPAPVVLRVSLRDDDEEGLSVAQLSEAVALVLGDPAFVFKGLALTRQETARDIDSFAKAIRRIGILARLVAQQGIVLETLGLGAGPRLPENEEDVKRMELYARLAHEEFAENTARLFFEPGESLIAGARVLVTRVLDIKTVKGKPFCVLDALFDQRCLIEREDRTPCEMIPVRQMSLSDAPFVCGDLLAVVNVGALGALASPLASGQALAPEVLISGARSAIVRRRVAASEQMEWEFCPDWIGGGRAA